MKLMSPTLRKLGIDRLTPQERLELIGEIWDSFDSAEELEVPQDHRDELDRRLAATEGRAVEGVSWEELRKRIEQGKR